MKDVAIIGGGISGLTAAYELQKSGADIIVLERQQQVGGNAISQRVGGFLMEHGPTTLNALVPQAVELAEDLSLGAERCDLSDSLRKRYLRNSNDSLHGISVHPAGFLVSSYLSIPARLSLLSEILRPARKTDDDETVHDFAVRRFGSEFAVISFSGGPKDVAIIGGGISGLTAAYELQKSGADIIVLERQQQVGGNAISQRVGGFLMEHGPTTLNALVPQAVELAEDLSLGAERCDLSDSLRKRYLRNSNDSLHGISVHPAGFLVSSYLSIPARLSLLSEILRPARKTDDDETVHDFAVRRFGSEFAVKVMAPLASGMFGSDSTRLSMSAAFPKLREMEQKHGSVTRGVMKARKGSEPGKRLFSFHEGIGMLPRRLARRLAGKVYTGAAVTAVRREAAGFRVCIHGQGSLQARAVIIAVQPHVAAGLLAAHDLEAAAVAADIDAPPMSVVFLAYRREQIAHPLDSLGFLSVPGSGGMISGAQFPSAMFAGRAPLGYVSLCAYVGGAANREAARTRQDELMSCVHEELAGLLQIRGIPYLSRCRQWVHALPQYELGHGAKVQILQSLGDRYPGLFVTGNYLKGVSVANCIAEARQVADAVRNHISLAQPAVAQAAQLQEAI